MPLMGFKTPAETERSCRLYRQTRPLWSGGAPIAVDELMLRYSINLVARYFWSRYGTPMQWIVTSGPI